MRIVGGEFKGRKLFSVRGEKTRPTADRTREAIFNILGSRIRGAIVLDLFAGTGAVGLEALSRGAQSAYFIENHQQVFSVLTRNIAACGVATKATALRWNVVKNLKCIQSIEPAFNLVFMDPPYGRLLVTPTLSNLHDSCCLKAKARLVIEHTPSETLSDIPAPFEIFDRRRYGKTLVSFLRYCYE
jgi:16S rRNA (guanine966-N2)-methyltransferase